MHLYNLQLFQSNHFVSSLCGSFIQKSKQQQIVTALNSEILIHSVQDGKLINLTSFSVFGIIHKIVSFKLTGSHRGYKLY